MFRGPSIKTKLIIFLIGFALFLAIQERQPEFLASLLMAVVFAVSAETLLLYFKSKTFQITESSVVTGLITGFVLSGDVEWWRFLIASVSAILSKYLIGLRKRHIFNPAAFGIFLALLCGGSSQWRGTFIWQALLPFGVYFAYKVRKMEILAGFAAAFLILFGGQAIHQKVPPVHVFGYMSYFYIFIMVIEPMTTPIKPVGKFVFGVGCACLIFVLTGAGARFDVELLSLLMMNSLVPLLSKLAVKKGGLA